MTDSKLKILVLISGSGTNLQALIDAVGSKTIDAEIIRVISSSAEAYGLQRAEKADIPTTVHRLKEYYADIPKGDRPKARKQFNKDLANIVLYGSKDVPDLIVCAGWMLILSPDFLGPLEDAGVQIINLHPALPGAFDGTHAIERAWKAGQDGEITKGGLMIHKVIQQVDAGEPLLVKEIDIVKGETVEEYEEKVHKCEHIAIVEGTNLALEEIRESKKQDK
ncbi:phosphoribosylglycinamide formyltransferase [Cyberlindnera jadinii NRRL Y-1542]|uniref:Phosphoribosylglycinamide formyltransferase n=1 Tax=Cyberlindnera jadinii (strain ATCC 18201 / CBS 1600 / BCRC 20928 / JCM 3617 / NBRC 0987 / NRRL Y-1542) TaxID=983966 RepID=A0A1E4RZG4_CYBJN|nr:phosphoribosylglycinamide formyltransferase [Cyberlindnera jadinii NRRL Y-1542]ODV72632.1 phosphoribosylglycinamide formyltransferase [Cyberlindnera jadinii NRRL Y-1542]